MQQPETEVENEISYKNNVYCNDGINKIYQHLDGTIMQTLII